MASMDPGTMASYSVWTLFFWYLPHLSEHKLIEPLVCVYALRTYYSASENDVLHSRNDAQSQEKCAASAQEVVDKTFESPAVKVPSKI